MLTTSELICHKQRPNEPVHTNRRHTAGEAMCPDDGALETLAASPVGELDRYVVVYSMEVAKMRCVEL